MKLYEIADKVYNCVITIHTPQGSTRRVSWTQKETRAAINRVPGTELTEKRGEFGPWWVRFSGTRDECLAIRTEVQNNLRSISRGGINMRFDVESTS